MTITAIRPRSSIPADLSRPWACAAECARPGAEVAAVEVDGRTDAV